MTSLRGGSWSGCCGGSWRALGGRSRLFPQESVVANLANHPLVQFFSHGIVVEHNRAVTNQQYGWAALTENG